MHATLLARSGGCGAGGPGGQGGHVFDGKGDQWSDGNFMTSVPDLKLDAILEPNKQN